MLLCCEGLRLLIHAPDNQSFDFLEVSIHYVWVASARSCRRTISADWRSCVDSQVLFKPHLYVCALLWLRRRYISTLRGLKWALLATECVGKKKKTGYWSATSHTRSTSLSHALDKRALDGGLCGPQPLQATLQKVWIRRENCWRAPRLLRLFLFIRQRLQVIKAALSPPKSLRNNGRVKASMDLHESSDLK